MLSGPRERIASAGSSYGLASMWCRWAGTKMKSPGPASAYSLKSSPTSFGGVHPDVALQHVGRRLSLSMMVRRPHLIRSTGDLAEPYLTCARRIAIYARTTLHSPCLYSGPCGLRTVYDSDFLACDGGAHSVSPNMIGDPRTVETASARAADASGRRVATYCNSGTMRAARQ